MSLAFVWGIHRGPVNSPHKWPVHRKCFHLMTSSSLLLGGEWPGNAIFFKSFVSIVVGSDNNSSILLVGLHGELKNIPKSPDIFRQINLSVDSHCFKWVGSYENMRILQKHMLRTVTSRGVRFWDEAQQCTVNTPYVLPYDEYHLNAWMFFVTNPI